MSTLEQVLSVPRIETSDLLAKFSITIPLPDDVAVLDEEFCTHVLNGATRRTAARYEGDGLPYLMIRGRKFRPLNAGRAWLATRIKAVQPQRRRRISSKRTHKAKRQPRQGWRSLTDLEGQIEGQ
jgi:hypothetical protein